MPGSQIAFAPSVVHFSRVFPVVLTPCGKVGPAVDRWGGVTCITCLETAPDDPRIKERRAAVVAEAEAKWAT